MSSEEYIAPCDSQPSIFDASLALPTAILLVDFSDIERAVGTAWLLLLSHTCLRFPSTILESTAMACAPQLLPHPWHFFASEPCEFSHACYFNEGIKDFLTTSHSLHSTIMFLKLLLTCLIPLGTLVAAQDTSLRAVKLAFDAADISSDLSITFNPKVLLQVTLPQPTGEPITLHAGIQLPRNSTAGPPSFSVVGPIGSGPFVVAAVDPDAPTPQTPTNAQIRHLLAPNFFPRRRLAAVLVNTTAALSEYRQPTPPAGSDAHRTFSSYIFLLFNQPAGFNSQTLVTPTTPINLFNISSFAASTGLGSPIAGTFMLVAPDRPVA
ncbi:Protein D2 [Hypsizygus marmoreus]|uniref:Protein D2 n=1 Tax=Hypsizygus marmoreus TaxID=39966 RepID=A0A369JAY8_HYPMA|nr:Protein D2 [Hypsizygus marmoreus]